jgi:hypothetical protein
MISALILPLLLSGEPAPAAATPSAQDDPPIQLWISNDRRFLPGESAKVEVRTEEDGYLVVLHVDPDGYLRVLFPLDPDKDNFVRGGKKYEVRGRGDRRAFEADGKGRGTVYAAVAREPFRFETFVVGDHWDYRTLAPSRLSSNPEPELNELIRRMAGGDFDYDILTYEVVDRAAYASNYYPRYNRYLYDDPWCYGFSCGRHYGSSITVFFGRPYRRYYYDPYFYAYDPFYNPFFYDPYYYAPAYYPRYIYPRRFYYPYRYSDPYRHRTYDRYHFASQPYTPYRFRGSDGFTGYRDRAYDPRRAVNTVYNPPVSREPAIAAPARRVIDPGGEALPSRAAPRRLVDDARRVVGRPVEARRARPAEGNQERSAGEPRLIRREAESPPRPEEGRAAPRAERAREAPRSIDREPSPRRAPQAEARPQRAPAAEARPQRAAPPDRGARGSEGRSSGSGTRGGGSPRPSNEGGRRPR